MATITDISEAWNGHSGLEVESFIKSVLGSKIGYVALVGTNMVFYDEESGTEIASISLGGQNYTINIASDVQQTFYVLADETTKVITITPTTTVSQFGSSTSENYPEGYNYTVAVNTGAGYVNRLSGVISTGGSASFDVRPFLATGDNYIRVTVTGLLSGQVRSTVYTGTLTTLTMSCAHNWQNVWNAGEDYNITGIRFAGSLVKTLHVSVNDVEQATVDYAANQSYTTTATYYTIPASAFPANASGVYSVKLWMTAQGVSTPVISYNIMCVASGDSTPLVCINAITTKAVNYTSGRLFSYATYNADKVAISMSATLNSVVYPIVTGLEVGDRETGVQYPFAYALEVDTGANETKTGTMAVSATAYSGSTIGAVSTASTVFDNTYSYVATPGALFALNASTRDNGAANHETIVNEGTPDTNFSSSYTAVWTGMSWYNDGWSTDADGHKALVIPAGCSVTVAGLAPLASLSSYPNGMTVEMMLQNGSPSDYSSPVFSLATSGTSPNGILIYPTKVVVWGSAERDEDYQTVNISENRMTHIAITFVKGYEGNSGKNLCSVYINGISNVCFAFDGASSFGDGGLVIGQADTDAYLYKMRVYGTALESQAVFNNFLNCIVDGVEFTRSEENAKNDLLDGSAISYEKVKAAGLNTMVITTPDNVAIPDFFNQVTVDDCTWKFEYAGHPAWNVTIAHIPIDGQGTTSKKYYRWNLRGKTGSSTTWSYGDGNSDTGKKGYIIKDGSHGKVDRITAKKNIASSPQGHKMGLTGLYNDLFKAVGLGSELPDSSYNVAVYQFPFVGFVYNTTNGTYSFIGLFTAGPDKGSKVTFGYSDSFPSLLSIEGPNHAPRGTRFLTPWVDVTFDPAEETLCYGGEEGWDADYVNYETSTKGTQADWDNILALYTSEWKPAYDCVYNNSPYIASAAEVIAGLNNPSIATLADLLTSGNANTVKAGFTNGMALANEFIAFYDTSYELYYYRRSTGKFESIQAYNTANSANLEHNVLTALADYLDGNTTPTTAEIIAARAARFKATMGNYFSLNQTLYHYCFCILWAVTDNFAKNSYPQKFRALADTGAGNRWGWRQDDLDSVLQTDNNGTNTKKYSVEHGDTAANVEIFQGGESALWVLIRDYYQTEVAAMMASIAAAAHTYANTLGIQGDGMHNSLLNLTSYYCWEHSAKYFPATLYEADRRWSYIEPWLMAGQANPGGGQYPSTYNGVAPLTQAVGDQYQGESLWMERRIAYIFSKYRIGAFSGQNDGYNAIAFTLASSFTFHITPAIDLYPVVSLGQDDSQGGRTAAGSAATVPISTSGGTNNYIHGGDWLASLGDLSDMVLTSRGGATAIPFSIVGARLQTLKIGDDTPSVEFSPAVYYTAEEIAAAEEGDDAYGKTTSDVKTPATYRVPFNATSFGITSPTITYLDARYTRTVTNNIDLLGCPRLRTCLFEGSGAAGLLLPVGAKLTEVSFPDSANTVFMHSLPFLDETGLTLPALGGITTIYINNCASINPLSVLEDILETAGNTLAYVTALWSGIVSGQASTLFSLSELAGSVTFENGSVNVAGGLPNVEGTVQVSGLYADDLEALDVVSEEDYQTNLKKALSRLFGTNLYIIYDPNSIYIRFVDDLVRQICATNWGDGTGITMGQAAAVTGSQFGYTFRDTAITTFEEFQYFTGVTDVWRNNSTTTRGAFGNCTSLKRIILPETITHIGGSSNSGDYKMGAPFYNCTSLERINIPSAVTEIGNGGNYNSVFYQCTKLSRVDITSLSAFLSISFPNVGTGTAAPFGSSTATERAFYLNGEKLVDMEVPDGITSIPAGAFYNCNGLETIDFNEVTSIGNYDFYQCTGLTSLSIPSTVTSIGQYAFHGCSGLTTVTGMSGVRTLGRNAFYNCAALTSDINLPSLTGTLPMLAFAYTAIKKVVSLGSITTIASNNASGPFWNCTALEEIALPSTLKTVSLNAFQSCTAVKKINITDLAAYCGITFAASANPFHYSTAGSRGLYLNGVLVTNLVIPNTVTAIGSSQFYRNNTITSVTIPSTVTSIGGSAFYQCAGLTSVSIPSTVTSIGQNAFYQCSGLTGTLTIPSSVTSIGQAAFTSVTSITNAVFGGNTSGNAWYYGAVGHIFGNGTGTLTVNGNLTLPNSSAGTFFLHYHITGNLIKQNNGGYGGLIRDDGAAKPLTIRIGGNLDSVGGSIFYSNANFNKLEFIEVGGTINNTWLATGSSITANCIMHLGYAGIAGTAANCAASAPWITKIYVGDGSSASHDNAILAQYTADSGWSAYASKLDTWYNYSGEYKD